MSINFGQVVELTNITNEDFTHNYGGTPYTIKAGQTIVYPYELAEHLAKHLARKILIAGDTSPKAYDGTDKTGGVGKPLWNEDSERKMMEKIMGTVVTNEVPEKEDPIKAVQKQIEELQKKFLATEAKPSEYKDKAQVVAELNKLEIKFDPKLSKDELIKLLPSTK